MNVEHFKSVKKDSEHKYQCLKDEQAHLEDHTIYYKQELDCELQKNRILSKEIHRLNVTIEDLRRQNSDKDNIINQNYEMEQQLKNSKDIQHKLKETIVNLNKELCECNERETDSKTQICDLNKEIKLISKYQESIIEEQRQTNLTSRIDSSNEVQRINISADQQHEELAELKKVFEEAKI